jgi:translation initiation factor 2B subunit (eIF-2B alpha/beta/delta family)
MKLKNNILSLLQDRKAGSTSILIKLNQIMKQEAGNREYMLLILKESRKQFNDFSIIQNYLDEIENKLSNKEDLLKIIDYYEDFDSKVNDKIFENGKEYFLGISRILTLSNSLTIANFLTRLHRNNKKLKVIITESRPRNEGRILAKSLIKQGIPVEFITDFSSAQYIQSADAILTGADKILSTGNIVNKTGSRALAILGKHFNKPFYVITTKNKKSKEAIYLQEEKESEEVWRYTDENLKVRNYYFEEIDSKLVTKVITD